MGNVCSFAHFSSPKGGKWNSTKLLKFICRVVICLVAYALASLLNLRFPSSPFIQIYSPFLQQLCIHIQTFFFPFFVIFFWRHERSLTRWLLLYWTERKALLFSHWRPFFGALLLGWIESRSETNWMRCGKRTTFIHSRGEKKKKTREKNRAAKEGKRPAILLLLHM